MDNLNPFGLTFVKNKDALSVLKLTKGKTENIYGACTNAVEQMHFGLIDSSAFLQFNCFLLMPVVDKLPVLLREDLESAFRDDLDNVFDITHLQQSLGQRKRDLEIELKRVSSVFCTVFRCRIICVDFFNTSCLLMSLSCPLCCFVLQMLRLKEKFRQIHEQLSTEQVRS